MKINERVADIVVLQELGARLAAARIAANLTQAALAERAGVAKRTVERLESGEVAVRLDALVRVLRALGLMDRLDVLVPAPLPSPLAQLKLAGRRPKRVGRAGAPPARRWTWGDGT